MSKGLKAFLACLGVVFVFNVVAALLVVPKSLVPILSILATFIALGVPIYALFRGSEAEWNPRRIMLFLFGGIGIQLLFTLLAMALMKTSPFLHLTCMSIGQVGLICWCMGFGALVAGLIKDKNLILPIAICLALLDIFFVMTPVGITQIVTQAAPKILPAVALHVPQPSTTGHIGQMGLVGPADLLFIAMFFVAIHRFGLRGKQTLYALIPTVVTYLLIVIFFGWVSIGRFSLDKLPGLPPIALVILLVNMGEFKLNKEEKISTVGVLALVSALLVWGMSRPIPPPNNVEVIQQGDINPEKLDNSAQPQRTP